MKTIEEFIDYVGERYDATINSDDAISKFYYTLFLERFNLSNVKRVKRILADYLVGFQRYIDDNSISEQYKEYCKRSFVIISDLWNYLMS